jgi:hypothetical protein
MVWGDAAEPTDNGLTSLPAHKKGSNHTPAGGNELFADGSASWILSKQMYNLYNPISGRSFYFYQSDLGSYNPASFLKGP